jgi:hypothetical protein
MKELIRGLAVFIGSTIVSILVLWFLFLYSFGYSIWLTVTFKDWKAFFKFWWRLIDGTLSVVGYILYHIGYAQDLLWNVNGEAIEDVVTTKEDTQFGKKNVSVSAAIGKQEIDGDVTYSGKVFSEILNVVFWQKQHAKDSWLFLEAYKLLESKYFEKKI